jgi:hypothetical protein
MSSRECAVFDKPGEYLGFLLSIINVVKSASQSMIAYSL